MVQDQCDVRQHQDCCTQIAGVGRRQKPLWAVQQSKRTKDRTLLVVQEEAARPACRAQPERATAQAVLIWTSLDIEITCSLKWWPSEVRSLQNNLNVYCNRCVCCIVLLFYLPLSKQDIHHWKVPSGIVLVLAVSDCPNWCSSQKASLVAHHPIDQGLAESSIRIDGGAEATPVKVHGKGTFQWLLAHFKAALPTWRGSTAMATI